MKKLAAMTFAFLAGLGLQAQGPDGFSVKGGLIRPQEDLIRVTQENKGIFGELSYRWSLNAEGFGLRAHAGHWVVRRGKDEPVPANTTNADLADVKDTYGGLDVVHPFKAFNQDFDFYLGLTMNNISMKRRVGGVVVDRGWKFGYRLGVSYRITERWGVDLNYGQTEHTRYVPRISETVGSAVNIRRNPSWFALGATYKF